MALRTKKECAGSYVRTDGKREVSVRFFDHLNGWIAAAKWDCHLLTDPVQTKRDAVFNADAMLQGWP